AIPSVAPIRATWGRFSQCCRQVRQARVPSASTATHARTTRGRRPGPRAVRGCARSLVPALVSATGTRAPGPGSSVAGCRRRAASGRPVVGVAPGDGFAVDAAGAGEAGTPEPAGRGAGRLG